MDTKTSPSEQTDDGKNHMVYVAGSKTSFHCEGDGEHGCGCNVFRKLPSGKYKCNACGTVWVGE